MPSSMIGRLLRRRALVVDPVAAPLARQASVVVGLHERLRDLVAELARRRRWRASGRRRPRARGRRPRAAARRRSRCRRRPASGPVGASTASSIVSALRAARAATSSGVVRDQLVAAVAALRLHPGLDAIVACARMGAARDDLGAEAHARAVVGGGAPIGVVDLDPAPALDVADAAPGRPRRRRRAPPRRGAQQVGLAPAVDVLGRLLDRMAGAPAPPAASAAGSRGLAGRRLARPSRRPAAGRARRARPRGRSSSPGRATTRPLRRARGPPAGARRARRRASARSPRRSSA